MVPSLPFTLLRPATGRRAILSACLAMLTWLAPGALAQQVLWNQLDPSLAGVSSGNAQIYEPGFSSSKPLPGGSICC